MVQVGEQAARCPVVGEQVNPEQVDRGQVAPAAEGHLHEAVYPVLLVLPVLLLLLIFTLILLPLLVLLPLLLVLIQLVLLCSFHLFLLGCLRWLLLLLLVL